MSPPWHNFSAIHFKFLKCFCSRIVGKGIVSIRSCTDSATTDVNFIMVDLTRMTPPLQKLILLCDCLPPEAAVGVFLK